MWEWEIIVEVWPKSSGNGAAADQQAAGERRQKYLVRADSVDEALKYARSFTCGLQRNPMVYKAPILGIRAIGKHIFTDAVPPLSP